MSPVVQLDRNGLQVLDRGECLRLLSTVAVCRVGVTLEALPAILPVNFILHDQSLIIRSSPRNSLTVALRNTVVAVEADDFDDDGSSGWSVLVRGHSREISCRDELTVVRNLGLTPWSGDQDLYINVDCHTISGRRFRTEPPLRSPRSW